MAQGASQQSLAGMLQLVQTINQQKQMRDQLLTSFVDKAAKVPYPEMVAGLVEAYDPLLGGGYADRLRTLGQGVQGTAAALVERATAGGVRNLTSGPEADEVARRAAGLAMTGETPEARALGRTEEEMLGMRPDEAGLQNLAGEYWSRNFAGQTRGQAARSQASYEFLLHPTEGAARRQNVGGIEAGAEITEAERRGFQLNQAQLELRGLELDAQLTQMAAAMEQGNQPDPGMIHKWTQEKMVAQRQLTENWDKMEPHQQRQWIQNIRTANAMLNAQGVPTEEIIMEPDPRNPGQERPRVGGLYREHKGFLPELWRSIMGSGRDPSNAPAPGIGVR